MSPVCLTCTQAPASQADITAAVAALVAGAPSALNTLDEIAAALGDDSSFANNVVLKSLFDANTILAADSDNTPAAVTVAASRILGRKASGGIAALTAAEVLALVSALASSDVQAATATLTDLAAGLTEVTVTLSPGFADTAFSAVAAVESVGAVALGLTAVKVTARTATTVKVLVSNVSVGALSGILHVIARKS